MLSSEKSNTFSPIWIESKLVGLDSGHRLLEMYDEIRPELSPFWFPHASGSLGVVGGRRPT